MCGIIGKVNVVRGDRGADCKVLQKWTRRYGMKKRTQRWLTLMTAGVMALSMASTLTACGKKEEKTIILPNVTQAKNVILLIGDGMGPVHIEAGGILKGEPLAMQKFPYMTTVETCSVFGETTDSAAAATALATGQRTENGMVGKDSAENDLQTIVDIAASLGKRTGIIATEELYGATPMGFASHATARGQQVLLLEEAAASSNVNLFASSVISANYKKLFTKQGYEDVIIVDEISNSTSDKIIGSYLIPADFKSMETEGAYTAFDRLVSEALEFLSKDEDGFFLMAEGSHIDHGGHNNDLTYMLEELMAFDDGVQAVLNWAKKRNDTVVIVTADHETGGFVLEQKPDHALMVEMFESGNTFFGWGDVYDWTSTGHTNKDVNLYINGADIDFAQYSFGTKDRIKNTDVFQIMKSLMTGK